MAEKFNPFTELPEGVEMSPDELEGKLNELLARLSEDPTEEFKRTADELADKTFAEMSDAHLGEGLQALALDVVTTNLTYRSLPGGTDEAELYGLLALLLHEAGRRLSVYTGRTDANRSNTPD